MTKPRPRLGLILYYFVLLSPLAIMALAAYPGIYTNDSFNQYYQMIEGRYINDHPIIMALWWRCLWLIFGHPAALLFFHLGLFAAGLLVWARFFHMAGLKWARLMLAIVPWTAPFMIHLGFMWKDVGQTGCLFLAYALAAWLHAAPQAHKYLKIGAYAAIVALGFYAFNVRVNGFAAVPPLLFLALWPLLKSKRRITLAVAGSLLGAIVFFGLNQVIISSVDIKEKKDLKPSLYLYDLTGISKIKNQDLLPLSIKGPDYDFSNLMAKFGVYSADSVPFGQVLFDPRFASAEQIKDLEASWQKTIRQYPGSYLKHRLMAFTRLLGLPGLIIGNKVWLPIAFYSSSPQAPGENSDYIPDGRLMLRQTIDYWLLMNFVYRAARWQYQGAVWALLSVVGLTTALTAVRRRRFTYVHGLLLSLNVSALAYMSLYFLVTLGADYRYLYWSIVASIVSSLIVVNLGLTGLGKALAGTKTTSEQSATQEIS